MHVPDKIERLKRLSLIAITHPERTGWAATERAAQSALAGGLPTLRLRDKDSEDAALRPVARQLRDRTRAAGSLFIVNGRPELALETGADGLHLGKGALDLAEARRRMGPQVLLGYSSHERAEALAAFRDGADYVLYSPIFETPSKRGILEPLGVDALGELAAEAPGPVIALGGVNESNAGQVLSAGAAGLAVIRAIFAAQDPEQATRRLLDLTDRHPLRDA